MSENYGRRKGDISAMLPPIEIPNMTDSQKVLNMLRDGLISHDTRLQGIRNELDEQGGDIQVLKKMVITGYNGELSHSERIRKLEEYAGEIKDAIRHWGRFIGGALLLNFLGFMTGIIVAVVQFLPLLKKLAEQP